ncbi:hypothetical protein ACFXPA_25750 [Amycolatopsis sp. NPDC059090]|uniref:hypothetical protein n=1 Tax=unclassified Amycolatopsis TaxID=2618356 RepID=UPI0036716716
MPEEVVVRSRRQVLGGFATSAVLARAGGGPPAGRAGDEDGVLTGAHPDPPESPDPATANRAFAICLPGGNRETGPCLAAAGTVDAVEVRHAGNSVGVAGRSSGIRSAPERCRGVARPP